LSVPIDLSKLIDFTAQFTSFTGTKVQILTQKARLSSGLIDLSQPIDASLLD
jgi:hypothetical protein